MIPAPWTAVRDTPNKSRRSPAPRRGVVLHHAAMTSLTTLRNLVVNGTKQVSATAICKDDVLELIVPDGGLRPWSLSSAYWDSALRSVETCNESVAGWTISDKSHWSLARFTAYWAEQDGFWPHRDGDPKTWTVLGHGEVYSIHGASYATACPGGLDLGLVTRRAQGLLRGASPAAGPNSPVVAPAPARPKEIDMLAFTPKDLLPGWNFLVGPGYIKNAPGDEANQYAAMTAQQVHQLDNAWAIKTLWNHGLGEFLPNGSIDDLKRFLQGLAGGKFAVASWRASKPTDAP